MTQPTLIPAPPSDAQLAAQWAADVAADPAAVFLDTETTSLDMDTVEVCDIAVVSVDGTVLLDELVRPVRPIPPAATAVHGIDDAEVRWAPAWRDVHRRVAALLHGRRVVVYNAQYDAGVVNGLCRRQGEPAFARDWECAMLAYGAFRGERSRRGDSYRWWKLLDAAAHFGITPGTHRALADAEATRQVVLAMSRAEQ